jgi:hypothetical protein
MIKRYEIRPRRKRTGNGNGAEPAAVTAAPEALPASGVAGSIAPAAVLDDK